jgi:hypothetical protein
MENGPDVCPFFPSMPLHLRPGSCHDRHSHNADAWSSSHRGRDKIEHEHYWAAPSEFAGSNMDTTKSAHKTQQLPRSKASASPSLRAGSSIGADKRRSPICSNFSALLRVRSPLHSIDAAPRNTIFFARPYHPPYFSSSSTCISYFSKFSDGGRNLVFCSCGHSPHVN